MDDLGMYEVRRCEDQAGGGHDQGKGSGSTSYPVEGEGQDLPQPEEDGGHDVGKGSGGTSYPLEGE